MKDTCTIEVPELPENERLRGIASRSAVNIVSLIRDHEREILRMIQNMDENKVTISHAIVVDIAKGKQTDKISFSLKHSDEISSKLDDLEQTDMFCERGGQQREVVDEGEQDRLQAPREALTDPDDGEIEVAETLKEEEGEQ